MDLKTSLHQRSGDEFGSCYGAYGGLSSPLTSGIQEGVDSFGFNGTQWAIMGSGTPMTS